MIGANVSYLVDVVIESLDNALCATSTTQQLVCGLVLVAGSEIMSSSLKLRNLLRETEVLNCERLLTKVV